LDFYIVNDVGPATDAGRVAHRLGNFVEEVARHQGIGVNEDQRLTVRIPSTCLPNSCDVVDRLKHYGSATVCCNIRSSIYTRVIDNDQFHTAPA
jgi:hypothetical protein